MNITITIFQAIFFPMALKMSNKIFHSCSIGIKRMCYWVYIFCNRLNQCKLSLPLTPHSPTITSIHKQITIQYPLHFQLVIEDTTYHLYCQLNSMLAEFTLNKFNIYNNIG